MDVKWSIYDTRIESSVNKTNGHVSLSGRIPFTATHFHENQVYTYYYIHLTIIPVKHQDDCKTCNVYFKIKEVAMK